MNKSICPSIHLESIEAVIFDVDGTLYDQKKLRHRMMVSLVKALWKKPHGWNIIRVIKTFREYRERIAHIDGKTSLQIQYDWVARSTQLEPEFVRAVIEEWIFKRPLMHLRNYLYDDVVDFFALLRGRGLKVGIYSDYPAKEKLEAMMLDADSYVCSTDDDLSRLKPSPKGLYICCEKLDVTTQKTLFIGDRDDHDGACARRANVPYLIIPRGRKDVIQFYYFLMRQFEYK